MPSKKTTQNPTGTETYRHPTAEALLRPDVGTQAQFRKKKPHATYRYDSSLDPAMSWDEGNEARENGEGYIAELLERIAKLGELLASADGDGLTGAEVEQAKKKLAEAQNAASRLKAMSAPFLNWSGKAERSEFEVPTLPLFVHERLSMSAVIDTVRGHKKGPDQLALFADPQHSITDQVLKAYEFPDEWVNRMILGDSMVVMNSLLHYEGMAGQVQMIYMDPPYGVKFGSNFQPFVRKRDVKHGDDDHMTYEPEMVQAYRDTWELGLHSWLTYMRDRLYLARELLAPSGSVFVQISDENVHHVKEVMDEVFGEENFVVQISFRTTAGRASQLLDQTLNYMLWYSKSLNHATQKYNQLRLPMSPETLKNYDWVETENGDIINLNRNQLNGYVRTANT